jgi:hypothetical protein
MQRQQAESLALVVGRDVAPGGDPVPEHLLAQRQ